MDISNEISLFSFFILISVILINELLFTELLLFVCTGSGELYL